MIQTSDPASWTSGESSASLRTGPSVKRKRGKAAAAARKAHASCVEFKQIDVFVVGDDVVCTDDFKPWRCRTWHAHQRAVQTFPNTPFCLTDLHPPHAFAVLKSSELSC